MANTETIKSSRNDDLLNPELSVFVEGIGPSKQRDIVSGDKKETVLSNTPLGAFVLGTHVDKDDNKYVDTLVRQYETLSIKPSIVPVTHESTQSLVSNSKPPITPLSKKPIPPRPKQPTMSESIPLVTPRSKPILMPQLNPLTTSTTFDLVLPSKPTLPCSRTNLANDFVSENKKEPVLSNTPLGAFVLGRDKDNNKSVDTLARLNETHSIKTGIVPVTPESLVADSKPTFTPLSKPHIPPRTKQPIMSESKLPITPRLNPMAMPTLTKSTPIDLVLRSKPALPSRSKFEIDLNDPKGNLKVVDDTTKVKTKNMCIDSNTVKLVNDNENNIVDTKNNSNGSFKSKIKSPHVLNTNINGGTFSIVDLTSGKCVSDKDKETTKSAANNIDKTTDLNKRNNNPNSLTAESFEKTTFTTRQKRRNRSRRQTGNTSENKEFRNQKTISKQEKTIHETNNNTKNEKTIQPNIQIDKDVTKENKNSQKIKQTSSNTSQETSSSLLKKRDEESDNCSRKDSRNEQTLYVVLTEKVSNNNTIKGYLLHRMGNPKAIEFDLVRVEQLKSSRKDASLVSIRFPSRRKANFAIGVLQKSNANFDNKLYCYLSEDAALGKELPTPEQENKDKLLVIIESLLKLSKQSIESHDKEIRNMQNDLSDITTKLLAKRLSLDMFDTLQNEKHAREDKLTELESQRREFTRYIQAMKTKLKDVSKRSKFETDVREIRKDFGVERHRLETALPMYARREDILNTIRHNQVSIVLGETGSGKSTQMVQYLYQAGFADDGLIACTQPRKIAALSLANFVSSELASSVGQTVGYKVGMQSKTTALTKIMFMTDHVLLNETLQDPDLSRYSCIIIDEAHERSIYTDLLLGMLKKCMSKRPELKVVITSATIDPSVFVSYFGGDKCPIVKVSGRTFPVENIWEDNTRWDGESRFPDNYEKKVLQKAKEIHSSHSVETGDILVFLTSPLETERCCEKFERSVSGNNYQCLQLHGRLKTEQQQLAFGPNIRGRRKIVFATNSAETSITIPGIKFVIDAGVAKEMRYDPKKNMNSLDVVPVSQSSANQRKGRAGRVSSGFCYRMYTENDYYQMEKTSSPEILRIHLGQGLLKLLELGVNPFSFDFVEAPKPEAMDAALNNLIDIGAVAEEKITELGRWIAKLPVEPRLGVMIKNGIDENVSVEVLMIASSCSSSGVFFRAGSQDEKIDADKKKVRFCHQGGDLLTMLNVFREWEKIPEKAKGKWCNRNSINGKAMKGIRETMNETMKILSKEANINIKHEFRDATEADPIIQKLIFNSLRSNICFYLGHEKAGYVTTDRMQIVQLHPSSSLLPLGCQPTWLVYGQILKTSDDFLTNVTPVSEEFINGAINDHLISINKDELKSMQIHLSLKVPIGKHVFWKFVGPRHTNRREIEDNIRAVCNNSVVVVEADKLRGEVVLFCLSQYKDDAAALLLSSISSISEQLLNECREETIGVERSGVRALLQAGGAVSTILMPDQFRAILLKQKEFQRYERTEEEVGTIFSAYGLIDQVWKMQGKKHQQQVFWGKVTFVNEGDAALAVDDINEDEHCEFYVEPETFRVHTARPQEYTMKLRWCRRPGKGFCYVCVSCPEDEATILCASPIEINGKSSTVEIARQSSDLYVRGLDTDTTEDDVKEGLLDVLGLRLAFNEDRFKVVMPRVEVSLKRNEMDFVYDKLSKVLQHFVPTTAFRINVKYYKPQTAFVLAFVAFKDPVECSRTAKCLIITDALIDGNIIDVSTEFKSAVFIKKRLYDTTKKDIDEFLEMQANRRSSTSVKLRVLKSGNYNIDIVADSPEKLAKIKVAIDTFVGGDVLEIGLDKHIHLVFTKDGKQQMQNIAKRSDALITVDERMMRVCIQGSMKYRFKATGLIQEYLSKIADSVEKEVTLKGKGNPPGMMKQVFVRYGTSLESLRNDTGLLAVYLNLRSHVLTLVGKEDAISKTFDIVEKIREDIMKSNKTKMTDEELPDCPICLCPVEVQEMTRIEYCGHAYCKLCLSSMIQTAVKDKKFPIKCAADDCGKSLVIRDITAQIKQGSIPRKDFVSSAVDCFVAQNNTAYKYCITADCAMVYKVTTDGTPFNCSFCQTSICTTCAMTYHEGMTCAMYKSAKNADSSVRNWLEEKPRKRKLCPKCEVGIEKIDGCDHMTCKCGAHICWKCMKFFDSGSDCYGHMETVHGSFV